MCIRPKSCVAIEIHQLLHHKVCRLQRQQQRNNNNKELGTNRKKWSKWPIDMRLPVNTMRSFPSYTSTSDVKHVQYSPFLRRKWQDSVFSWVSRYFRFYTLFIPFSCFVNNGSKPSFFPLLRPLLYLLCQPEWLFRIFFVFMIAIHQRICKRGKPIRIASM